MRTRAIIPGAIVLLTGYYLLPFNSKEAVPPEPLPPHTPALLNETPEKNADNLRPTIPEAVNTQYEGLTDEELKRKLLNHPKTQAYFSAIDSAEEYQKYFSDSEPLDSADQKALSRKLITDINDKENKRIISKPEAVFLKLALMKKLLPQDEFKVYAEGIIKEYKTTAEAGRLAYKNREDPQFKTYKQHEAEIAKEVLEMENFPNGLTREQYLRQRLDALRNTIYSNGESGG